MTSYFELQSQGIASTAVGKQPVAMVKFPTTSQGIKDMAVEAVTANDFFSLYTFEKFGIDKMFAPMF